MNDDIHPEVTVDPANVTSTKTENNGDQDTTNKQAKDHHDKEIAHIVLNNQNNTTFGESLKMYGFEYINNFNNSQSSQCVTDNVTRRRIRRR